MSTYDKYTLLPDVCKKIKQEAAATLWNGQDQIPSVCRWSLELYAATLIFTREVGYHSRGWWKNPEYERCWHLSISFRGGKDKNALKEIIKYLFSPYERWIWVEPPHSSIGKNMEVWHYRLFCDQHWQPIKPKGEVYNTHFTEKGWKSFSELNDDKKIN